MGHAQKHPGAPGWHGKHEEAPGGARVALGGALGGHLGAPGGIVGPLGLLGAEEGLGRLRAPYPHGKRGGLL